MQVGARGASSRAELTSVIAAARQTILGWFQALMPREERFFTLFEKHAGIVVAGAEALRGLLQGGKLSAQVQRAAISRLKLSDRRLLRTSRYVAG
jgi:hypothetical protein